MRIHDSVEKILRSKEVFGRQFYEVFFRKFPEVEQYFRGIDMERQSLVLTLAVSIVEQYFTRGYPATEKYLKYLGTQHHKRGIPREVYPMWRDAMLETLQNFLGNDWDEELAGEWRAAIQRSTTLMFEGYDEYFRV
jgi:hemoglobin-like flavoprotein